MDLKTLQKCLFIKVSHKLEILNVVKVLGYQTDLFLFVLVNIKWGKEKFENVELNTEEPTEVFKAQLFALSSVPPERQKVMLKGAVLKVNTLDFYS